MSKQVKRLFLDIETSFSVVTTFTLWPKSIPIGNIVQDWHIICASWKWEGEKKIHNSRTYTTNDKKVCKDLAKVIAEADELVYHNGTKFDFKKINTRILMHRLPPIPKPRETDTLTQAKKHFAFTSNRLDYIARVLVDDCKIANKPGLWMDALNKDKKAIDAMAVYCNQDVVLLEKVFNVMRPHIDLGFNVNIKDKDSLVHKCTHCGGNNLQSKGFRYTKTGSYRRYVCKDCGGYSSSGNREKYAKTPIR